MTSTGGRSAGTTVCAVCGQIFTWHKRERNYCPKCERRCPHCHAYARGSTHCRVCGKHRALSIAEFVEEAPPLSFRQLNTIARLMGGHVGPPRCKVCGNRMKDYGRICDECIARQHP